MADIDLKSRVRTDSDAAERDAFSDDAVPAAFWSNLPSDETNSDLMALNALKAESTPAERALTLKVSCGRAD